jgi:TfoX/Sxy family transcriptional regulator of competence genes
VKWQKSPPELVELFERAVPGPPVEIRAMFGYPAAFVNGNMWTGLHTTNWVVRLPDDAREDLFRIDGARPFEPVPGRPMTGFATLPSSVLADPKALHEWLSRAWQHAATMAPKASKAKSAKSAKR